MLFETESREVNPRSEDFGLSKDADPTNTVNLHLHVRIAIWISQVGEMRPPCSIFRISLDNDGILVQGICQC